MENKKTNIPIEFRGGGNKKKFTPSEMLVRKVIVEIDAITRLSGLKDYQVAERMGLNKNVYSRIKNQKTSLNMGNVEAIANALGYSVEIKLVKKDGAEK